VGDASILIHQKYVSYHTKDSTCMQMLLNCCRIILFSGEICNKGELCPAARFVIWLWLFDTWWHQSHFFKYHDKT